LSAQTISGANLFSDKCAIGAINALRKTAYDAAMLHLLQIESDSGQFPKEESRKIDNSRELRAAVFRRS
jgi:hypothetical protein